MSFGERDRRRPARTIGGERAPASRRRGGPRPELERLEDRTVLTSFTAASVADLIADINASNAAGGTNTITLLAGSTFTLTSVNNNAFGPTGLPVIATNDNLTIVGNGDVIQRSTAAGVPEFRLFDVWGALNLQNLTLQGGVAPGPVGGGAIHTDGGTLNLSGVTIQNNLARGFAANGGGIYADGASLTMQDSTIRNNQAVGSDGPDGVYGQDAHGGGLFILRGSAVLRNVNITANTAQGGKGGAASKHTGGGHTSSSGGHGGGGHGGTGNGGNALGGGMYVGGATVTLLNSSITNNSAKGGLAGGNKAANGLGEGGGLYIAALSTVGLDAFTFAHVTGNTATTDSPNIYGSYTVG